MSLQKLDFLDTHANTYKTAKLNAEQSSEKIQKAIETHTKHEVDAVNQAIKNLNEKVERIMETAQIKQEQEVLEKSYQEMSQSIKIAADTYFKVLKVIKDKQDLIDEKKREYSKQLYKKIIEKFLSPEEIEAFERLVALGPMVLVGNPMISQGSLPIDHGNTRF